MISYAEFFTSASIFAMVSALCSRPRRRLNTSIGMPETLARLQMAISESPCSPTMRAWTLRGSTPRCSPSTYLKRAVSSTVPDPMMRFAGNPESLSAT